MGILNVTEFASYQRLHLVKVLFYDPYSSFLNYQFLHYLVSLVFMSNYGLIVMVFSCCVRVAQQLYTLEIWGSSP